MKIKRVYLEITNVCNLNCPFCTNEKGQSFMDFNTISNYLKQIKEVSDYVYLHVLGEPLLHRDIDRIFDLTDSLSLNVQLVTNGILLDKHMNLLDHPSLRKLSISIHSISNSNISNTYYESINELIEHNHSKNIELRFYDDVNLSQDVLNYKEYLIAKYNIQDTNKQNSYKLKDNVYIYYADLFKWPCIDDPFISNNGKCHGGIDQIAILHNDDVCLCCLDPKGYTSIGNLKKDTLISILDSSLYKEAINNFKNNKLTFELCKRCSYRLRFGDTRNSKQ